MKGLLPAATRLMPLMMLAFLTLATVQILIQLHLSPAHVLEVALSWVTRAGWLYAVLGSACWALVLGGIGYEWRAGIADRKASLVGQGVRARRKRRRRCPRHEGRGRGRIPNQRMIDTRPAEVKKDKDEPGHEDERRKRKGGPGQE